MTADLTTETLEALLAEPTPDWHRELIRVAAQLARREWLVAGYEVTHDQMGAAAVVIREAADAAKVRAALAPDLAREVLRLRAAAAASQVLSDADRQRGAVAQIDAEFFGVQPLPCGHPASCVVSSDEGTGHCGWCEEAGRADRAEAELRDEEAGWALARERHRSLLINAEAERDRLARILAVERGESAPGTEGWRFGRAGWARPEWRVEPTWPGWQWRKVWAEMDGMEHDAGARGQAPTALEAIEAANAAREES